MIRQLPSARRTSTDLKAFREGRARLRVIGATGSPLELLETLLLDLESRPAVRASQSAHNYRMVYEVTADILIKLATAKDVKARASLLAHVRQRMDRAPVLQAKRVKSTSGETGERKEKVSTRTEKLTVHIIKRVLADLKAHAETYSHYASGWVVFYICSASRIGWRPCEVQGAYVQGDTLFIHTAKLRRGHVQIRAFPLDKVPENSRFAAGVICQHLPIMGWLEFQRWRNRLAEALSQSCDRLGIDRISLYACRHIAIQTWRAAGLSKSQIAELAGHMNLRAAGRHYSGRAGRDWLSNTPLDQPAADPVHLMLEETDYAEAAADPVQRGAALGDAPEVDMGEDVSFGNDGAGTSPQDQAAEVTDLDLDDFPVPARASQVDLGGGAKFDGLPAAALNEREQSGSAPCFDPEDVPELPKIPSSRPEGVTLWNEYRNRLGLDDDARPALEDGSVGSVRPG